MYPGRLSLSRTTEKQLACTSAGRVIGRGGFIHPKSSSPNSLEKRDQMGRCIDPSRAPGGIGVRYCLRLERISGEIFSVHGIAVYIHPDHETCVTTRTALNHGAGVSPIDATSNQDDGCYL
jgi:hypothetical protein